MKCAHCGADLSLEDMTKPNCPYCKNVLAHHARAAEHATLVNQMLDQRIGQQYPGGLPGGIPNPQIGYSYGAPINSNYQQAVQFQQQQALQVANVGRRVGWIMILAFAIPALITVLAVVIGALMFFVR